MVNRVLTMWTEIDEEGWVCVGERYGFWVENKPNHVRLLINIRLCPSRSIYALWRYVRDTSKTFETVSAKMDQNLSRHQGYHLGLTVQSRVRFIGTWLCFELFVSDISNTSAPNDLLFSYDRPIFLYRKSDASKQCVCASRQTLAVRHVVPFACDLSLVSIKLLCFHTGH